MTTVTFDINDEIYQQAQNLANDKKMSLAELFNFFIQKESKSAPSMDFSDIEAIAGKYTKYAKNSQFVSIEDMNHGIAQAIAEEWQVSESR